MDFQALSATFPQDKDMPARAARIDALTRVLDGTLYDGIPHSFDQEFRGSTDEYVPLRERRPSVRTNLCRLVVEDSVSMLFSEGHWPTIQAGDENTTALLSTLVRVTRLNETMLAAATQGSVGSVVVLLQILERKPFFTAASTVNLTPEWAPTEPDRLIRLTERYKVKGKDLATQGYAVSRDDWEQNYWFQRVWDETDETWFAPQPVTVDAAPTIDADRSLTHGLGFLPAVWIRNLPGGPGPDGTCTFEPAITNQIEADYLLSQAGRGLNYSSDPKLVLKSSIATAPVGGSANALVMPPDGDAKLLEINGSAAKTVLEHVRELRSIALEAVHGNRAHPEKLASAQSGRAMEIMMSGLIWTADRLRITYGEGGLLSLMRMVCQASQRVVGGLTIGDEAGAVLHEAGLALHWPAWFSPTPQDLLATAQGVVTAYAGGIISRKTAVTRMSTLLGIDDVTAEIELLEQADAVKAKQTADAAEAARAALPDAGQVRSDASAGKTDTRQATA